MKVGFFPYTNKSNYYVNIVQSAIERAGYKVVPLENASDSDCVAVVFNWYEDIYNKNPIKGFVRYREKVGKVAELKKQGKKIIYVLHDKQPHNSKFAVWAYLTKRYLLKHADSIVILCNETKNVLKQIYKLNQTVQRKLCLIPHPNYIGCYDDCAYNMTREKLGISQDTIVYLHIGGIAPYKNVELILDAAEKMHDKDALFLIAGPAPDNEYTAGIKQRIENMNNVRGIYGFVPNNEMAGLIETADVFMIPHNLKSALNSGTALLAFSYKRTAICSMIGTVKDFPDSSMFFGYTYTTKDEETAAFTKCVQEFYKKFYMNRGELNALNQRVFEYARDYHSVDVLTQKYKEIIEK